MRILMRAWRYLFDYSEIPSNAPAALDDSRLRWSSSAFLVPFAVTLPWLIIGPKIDVGIDEELTALLGTGVTIVIFGGSLIAAFWLLHGRADARFLAIRETAKAPAVAAGYAFHETFPPPLPATSEAVFYKSRYPFVPVRLTQVITGTSGGRRFTAGHLEGVEVFRTTGRRAQIPRSENIVMIALPSLLPELKLRDRGASTTRDYGYTLPAVPSGDAAVDARWDVQSHHPELVRQFMTPEMRAYLIGVPFVPCTMVIRNGYLIACRDPRGDFESISQRLAIMNGFIERVPAALWQRETTDLEAGAGALAPWAAPTVGQLFRR